MWRVPSQYQVYHPILKNLAYIYFHLWFYYSYQCFICILKWFYSVKGYFSCFSPCKGIFLEPQPPVEPTVPEVHKTVPDTGITPVQTLNLDHPSECNASNVDQRDPLQLSRISTNQVSTYCHIWYIHVLQLIGLYDWAHFFLIPTKPSNTKHCHSIITYLPEEGGHDITSLTISVLWCHHSFCISLLAMWYFTNEHFLCVQNLYRGIYRLQAIRLVELLPHRLNL